MNERSLVEILIWVGCLKRLKRAGWVQHGIEDGESVSEHSFHTALIAMIISDNMDLRVDKVKLCRMALIHDLPEVVVGDVTPRDVIPRAERELRELKAIQDLFRGDHCGGEYARLLIEYHQQETREAKVLRAIDKLEMAIQAYIYETEKGRTGLNEFYADAEQAADGTEIKELFIELKKLRGAETNGTGEGPRF
jgi:putative hydrolase of HD superfamily